VSTCSSSLILKPSFIAQLDQAVEDRFPVAVAGEIVVGDEEPGDALLRLRADDRLDVVGGAEARLAALHVDDGAEAALERAAAASVEARILTEHARDRASRQGRCGGRFEVGQIAEVVIDRFERSGVDIAQQPGDATFGFAGEQGDAEIERLLKVGRQFAQHGQAAADVEAAHHDGEPSGAERAPEIERAWKLIRLHAHQPDEAGPCGTDVAHDAAHPDDRVHFVVRLNLDVHVRAEHSRVRALRQQAVDAGEAVRRHHRPQPLNDVAVVVVMRRHDQDDLEPAFTHRGSQYRSLRRMTGHRWMWPSNRTPRKAPSPCKP
jgi:hypothetical protein